MFRCEEERSVHQVSVGGVLDQVHVPEAQVAAGPGC